MIQISKDGQDETLQKRKTCKNELVTRLSSCTICMEFQLKYEEYIRMIIRERIPIIYDD